MLIKNNKGITLITLVITIIILLILAGIAINLTLGDNGLFSTAKQAKEETLKTAATEKMNLKITNIQIDTYTKEERMPTLQEFSDNLCEDNEIEYVELQSKKEASLEKINVGEASSIFTKLKDYPYEFEINSSLQLASIDGIKVATNNNESTSGVNYSLQETKTNDTWMGKTIYTKTIYINSLPNKTYASYSHGIENVDSIWFDLSNSYVIWWDGVATSISYVHDVSTNAQITVQINTNEVTIYCRNSDYSSCSAYVTVRYTKTTDSAS